MKRYITIDGGTTNTRLSLVLDNRVIDTVRYAVGARAGIEDKTVLKNAVREGISKLLSANRLVESDICRILASGMITSEFGLYRLDHLSAPAGLAELHAGMEEVILSDVCSIPFVFLRGVRQQGDILHADVMRGEETELMGLCPRPNCVYILPGSHSKIIRTDENCRIASFSTTLTGEMIAALSQNTILKSSVSLADHVLCKESLFEGYRVCKELGMNAALFKVRVSDTVKGYDSARRYSFFMGVILCPEIEHILSLCPDAVTVGGKQQIREAICALLSQFGTIPVHPLSNDTIDTCVPLGAIGIYEYKA